MSDETKCELCHGNSVVGWPNALRWCTCADAAALYNKLGDDFLEAWNELHARPASLSPEELEARRQKLAEARRLAHTHRRTRAHGLADAASAWRVQAIFKNMGV
jgi:hypothetical protein